MDGPGFDDLVRRLASRGDRRGVLKALVGAAAVGAATLVGAGPVDARKRKLRCTHGNPNDQCLDGQVCLPQSNRCCPADLACSTKCCRSGDVCGRYPSSDGPDFSRCCPPGSSEELLNIRGKLQCCPEGGACGTDDCCRDGEVCASFVSGDGEIKRQCCPPGSSEELILSGGKLRCCEAGRTCGQSDCCAANEICVHNEETGRDQCCSASKPVPCGDKCCADGAVCAHDDSGERKCCPAGSNVELCGGRCCPEGRSCCDGQCCADGQPCDENGACPPCPEGERPCGDSCCPDGQKCCGTVCCPAGETCLGDGQCGVRNCAEVRERATAERPCCPGLVSGISGCDSASGFCVYPVGAPQPGTGQCANGCECDGGFFQTTCCQGGICSTRPHGQGC